MFKKLKDKIAEEVKQSPLKSVQQLAQAVVSPSSSSVFEPSSSNDKFCIEEGDIEEDEKQDQAKPGGFTSVTLTGQTTSPIRLQNQKYGFRSSSGSLMAEADNFFPKFEPQPTNFHVQSDWESASEVEDRYSQLEHINKESLYEAYRKVYNKYNRMKNKYHEIVTHYRRLERETEKAKTVLTETQDKALLRISELREQCLLEQQAKAHLEEALRNELEERDHIINTLRTKVQYLKGVSDSSVPESMDASVLSKEEANLIDFTDNSSVSAVPLPFDASNREEKIKWFEEKLKNLISLLNEDSSKVEQLKIKLGEVKKQNCEFKDISDENMGDRESSVLDQQSEKELDKTLSGLITKLSVEVQTLQKSAVHSSLLKSVNALPNLELKSVNEESGKMSSIEKVDNGQGDEKDSDITSIRELEEQNKALTQKLNEEILSAKELKNKLNTLSTITDVLRRKIKLSNENFGKNDAINCLITDVEDDLIQEWNVCFQNFLQTRCEVTVLKDMREDLEEELLRLKDEVTKLENVNKELAGHNKKLKEDFELLNKDFKSYRAQIETLNKEVSDLKLSNENFQKQIKKLEETLSHNEKVTSERHKDLQKIAEEKNTLESELVSLKAELQNINTKYSLLLETKEKLEVENLSLKEENSDVIAEKESLNNKVNEIENKLKQLEEDHKMVMDTRDGLDNQINSLTKLTEELNTEKNILLSRISNLEKNLNDNKLERSLLLEEKEKIFHEMARIKDDYETINREKLSITEKLHDIAKELENTKQCYSKSLESTQQCSDETVALKKEIDELIEEKQVLETKIESLNKEIEKLKSNCCEVTEVKNGLSEELIYTKEERDKLLLEIQLIQSRIVELDSASRVSNKELSVLQKEHSDLITEKDHLQKEIQKLQECRESDKESYSSFSESNMKLSQELSSLKKEKDDLIKEKKALENQLRELDSELSNSKEQITKLSEVYKELSDKLQTLQKEHEGLIMSKEIDQGKINAIKEDLKQKEEIVLRVNEKNKILSEEIASLKNVNYKIEKDYKLLQDKYNSGISDCENHNSLISSLTESKVKLSEEVNQLKKDCDDNYDILNETKIKLEIEQNTSSELRDQLCSISESLKKKCEELNEKYLENLHLQTELEKLMEKINGLNCCIEKLTKEKNIVLNYLLTNLNNVKMIKELQKNLYDFVKQFQVEISHEIDDINLKMGHDLLKHLNDLLETKTYSKKIEEVECKSKEDIDSYNSKLKNLQGQSAVSEEVLQVRASALESALSSDDDQNPNMVKFRWMGNSEKLAEPVSNNHCDSQAYLIKAISLMKSFTNLLNHNSINSDYSADMFTPDNEKCIKLNESGGKNLQKEIVAMESFITEFETKCKETYSQCIKSQELNDSDNANKHENSSELQLSQEIRLKDDIIKKLQSVIEDYEQKKDVDDGEFIYKQKVHMLEQENKSLTDKLKKLQETHELNVKNIISEYEKKLEEIEDENNLYDFEKQGENKHVVNEMKEQIQNLQQDLEERGDAFEKLYEEHQQSVKSLDEEIQQLRSSRDKELREQDKKWRQCLDRRLAEEEARHQQELASLNAQWNAERRELETARRLAVNAIESGSGSNELLRRQVQALTLQLTELRNSRCEACNRKRKNDMGEDHTPRSIQDCTEMEYLRNILYEYMMGKEPLVLAKVLCALVKFDENQTKEIVSKEEHRITLFGQLGLL